MYNEKIISTIKSSNIFFTEQWHLQLSLKIFSKTLSFFYNFFLKTALFKKKTVPIFNFCHLFGKYDHALIFGLLLILAILFRTLTKLYITLDILIVEGITFQHTERAGIIGFFPVILEGTISGALDVKIYVRDMFPKDRKAQRARKLMFQSSTCWSLFQIDSFWQMLTHHTFGNFLM